MEGIIFGLDLGGNKTFHKRPDATPPVNTPENDFHEAININEKSRPKIQGCIGGTVLGKSISQFGRPSWTYGGGASRCGGGFRRSHLSPEIRALDAGVADTLQGFKLRAVLLVYPSFQKFRCSRLIIHRGRLLRIIDEKISEIWIGTTGSSKN